LWSATALVVGHTIGVGIFLTPAAIIGTLASPAWVFGLWAGCGALAVAGALTFGELASRHPQAGGVYVYLREGWGRRAAFLYGWQSMLVMDPGIAAALATGVSPYFVTIWPAAAGRERWLAIAMIWALALVAIGGLRVSARAVTALTAWKMLALAAIIVLAFTRGDGSWAHFAQLGADGSDGAPSGQAFAIALVAVFFSFGGFWEASRVADLVRRPGRTLPLALVLGVTVVTTTYMLTTAAFIYLVPSRSATSAASFARFAGEAMFGAAGPPVFAAIVILSVAASAMALLIMAPRLYIGMRADGVFPAALASIEPRTGTPMRATLLLAALATLFSVAGTFQQIVTFFMGPTLAFVALAAAALVPLRRRAPHASAFRAPGYPLTIGLFVGLLGSVLVVVAVNQPLQTLAGFAVVLLGGPAYRLARPNLACVSTGVER
jgi:APA family basic amino acid/polyamine antiporter